MPEEVQQPPPQPQVSNSPKQHNWKKIIIVILILIPLIVIGFIASRDYILVYEPFSTVPKISEDEAIDLAKNCQITHGTYVVVTTTIYLKDGTERRIQGHEGFYNALDNSEYKCGKVEIEIQDGSFF